MSALLSWNASPFLLPSTNQAVIYIFKQIFTGVCMCHGFCRIYEGLTNCTCQVALRMDCFWPNRLVDDFFMKIHNTYFHHCALTGRLLHEPSIGILAPFIGVSVLIALLMTSVVVWRSKRTEGML
uniref:Receptor activity-modifying protein 1 n=1 Tax=Xiphophorus couchianus TaxID=32473 RepID=A0A3B5MV06_9TELE